MLFGPPKIREIYTFDPLSLQKVAIMTLFWNTWHILNHFLTKGAKIAIFLIGGRNRNISKLKGQKVLLSQYFII